MDCAGDRLGIRHAVNAATKNVAIPDAPDTDGSGIPRADAVKES